MTEHSKSDYDYVVIGSGVTGALVAWELARNGKSVCMVEAGDWIERWKAIEHYRSLPNKDIKAASPYPNLPWAKNPIGGGYLEQKGPVDYGTTYVRMVGGTTWHWDSATWRLIPSDFKLKSTYGVGRDWPIGYEDLEPFYQRAEEELGVNGWDEEDQSGGTGSHFPPRSQPYPTPGHPFSFGQQIVADRLKAQGYAPIHEPNARLSKSMDGGRNARAIIPATRSVRSARNIRPIFMCERPLMPAASCFQTLWCSASMPTTRARSPRSAIAGLTSRKAR